MGVGVIDNIGGGGMDFTTITAKNGTTSVSGLTVGKHYMLIKASHDNQSRNVVSAINSGSGYQVISNINVYNNSRSDIDTQYAGECIVKATSTSASCTIVNTSRDIMHMVQLD